MLFCLYHSSRASLFETFDVGSRALFYAGAENEVSYRGIAYCNVKGKIVEEEEEHYSHHRDWG